MCKNIRKLKPIQKQLERKADVGQIGMARQRADKIEATMQPVEYQIPIPVNPTIFDNVKYSFQWMLKIIRQNDLEYRKGNLNMMFSIKWFYGYAIAALIVYAMQFHIRYRYYVLETKRIPEIDERRKQFDPFSVENNNISMEDTNSVLVQETRSRDELREDSTFVR